MVGIIGVLLLCFSISMPVFAASKAANTNRGSDLYAAEETLFEALIRKVLEIKEESPQLTETEMLQIVNEEMNQRTWEARGIEDIWSALTDAEKKLIIRYPLDALKVNKAKDIATTQTQAKFGHNGLGDRSDAFRHGIWNAEMAIMIGMERAELFATAHEEKDTTGVESDGYSKIEHKNMDLNNNKIGRGIGNSNMSVTESELSNIIYASINQESSAFIWLHE